MEPEVVQLASLRSERRRDVHSSCARDAFSPYPFGMKGPVVNVSCRRAAHVGARRNGFLICCGVVCMASAWELSTYTRLSIATPMGSVGLAFCVAVIAAATGIGTLAKATGWAGIRRAAVFALPLLGIGALLLASMLASVLVSDRPSVSLVGLGRVGVVVCFGVAFFCATFFAPSGLRRALAISAAALIVQNAALLVLGLMVQGFAPTVFETGPHEMLGNVPRFQGFAGTPTAAGHWSLLAMGLVQWLPRRDLRRCLTCLGIPVVLATLSLASLALIGAFAWAVGPRPGRAALCFAAILVILGTMHTQVLCARIGAKTFVLSRHLPEWERDGLGPKYMPEQTLRAGPVQLEWLWTGYHYLAVRGLICFVDHPVLGVGDRRFAARCPVMTMSTYGYWSPAREPHNQYTGWLAEQGTLGLVAVACAIWLSRRCLRLRKDTPALIPAALVGSLIVGLGGDAILTLPVVGAFATSITRRAANYRSIKSVSFSAN